MIDSKRLENAKVGDWVFVYYHHGKSLHQIERITPKGFLKVGGSLYTQDGYERGGNEWHRASIALATPDEVEKFQKQVYVREVVAKLGKLTSNDIDYEMAVSLDNILSLGIYRNKENNKWNEELSQTK